MRKKLDTRFPAARIKRIMQADEEVGKIALATPVLISKALELFLQDLCDRAYTITNQKGAKTVSAAHLKQCIASYSEYDFLREVAEKNHEGSPEAEDQEKPKLRRKPSFNDEDSEDCSHRKKPKKDASLRGGSKFVNEIKSGHDPCPPAIPEDSSNGLTNVRLDSAKAACDPLSVDSEKPNVDERLAFDAKERDRKQILHAQSKPAEEADKKPTLNFDLNFEPEANVEELNAQVELAKPLTILVAKKPTMEDDDDYD